MRNRSMPNVLRALITQSIDAQKPTDLEFGEVISERPLQIKTENKKILDSDFLVLSDMVRNYSVDIEVSHTTENAAGGSGEAAFSSHCHQYKGRKKIRVYNALKTGEQVVMLKQAGGQLYYVICRYNKTRTLTGQWG